MTIGKSATLDLTWVVSLVATGFWVRLLSFNEFGFYLFIWRYQGGKILNNQTIVNYGLQLTDACWNTYNSTTYVWIFLKRFCFNSTSILARVLALKHSLSNLQMAASPAVPPPPPARSRSTNSTASTSQGRIISSVPRSSSPTSMRGESRGTPSIWIARLPLSRASTISCLLRLRLLASTMSIPPNLPKSTIWRVSGLLRC